MPPAFEVPTSVAARLIDSDPTSAAARLIQAAARRSIRSRREHQRATVAALMRQTRRERGAAASGRCAGEPPALRASLQGRLQELQQVVEQEKQRIAALETEQRQGRSRGLAASTVSSRRRAAAPRAYQRDEAASRLAPSVNESLSEFRQLEHDCGCPTPDGRAARGPSAPEPQIAQAPRRFGDRIGEGEAVSPEPPRPRGGGGGGAAVEAGCGGGWGALCSSAASSSSSFGCASSLRLSESGGADGKLSALLGFLDGHSDGENVENRPPAWGREPRRAATEPFAAADPPNLPPSLTAYLRGAAADAHPPPPPPPPPLPLPLPSDQAPSAASPLLTPTSGRTRVGAGSAAGSASAASAAKQPLQQRGAELAQTVYAGVKHRMGAMRAELSELRDKSAALQRELAAKEEEVAAATAAAGQEAREQIAAAKAASEEAVGRHLAFIDRLLDDKAELAKQCEALEHRARASEERCRSPRLRLTSAPIMND